VDLQTAAARLGVHYQTAYRWVRDGSLPAMKRGTTYEISEGDLEEFRQRREAPVPPPRRTIVRSWEHHVDRLYEELAVGDELGARAVVDRLYEGGIELLELCEQLFTPVLVRVGQEWANGTLSVAEEHRASAICERLLARLAVHPRGRPRGVAVVATATGEEHSLPAAMAALALRSDRWQVHHLGTQVPTDDLIDLVRVLDADLVVLSSANVDAREATSHAAERVRSSTRSDVIMGKPGDTLRGLLDAARSVTRAASRA
jgi:MerR family transcriptional regulator, light-induced transcriptional regulator